MLCAASPDSWWSRYWARPAAALPGRSVSPRASSVVTSPVVSVCNGTLAARACAGVSLASQPDSVKVNRQTPPAAAPLVMKSRLEFIFDIDPGPTRRLVRLLVAAAQRREIESLHTRMRIREVLHVQVDFPLVVVRAPTQSRVDHRVGGELVGREVAQVIEEAVGIVSAG